MLCGPFPNQLAEGVTEYFHDKTTLGYSIDYLKPIGGESNVLPQLEQSFTSTNGKQYAWEKYKSKENHINLLDVYKDNQKVVAYAAVTLVSDGDQQVVLSLGSNDGIKAWVNDKIVWNSPSPRPAEPDEDWVKVKLKKGDNSILLKVVQVIGNWGFYSRFLSIEEKRAELLKK